MTVFPLDNYSDLPSIEHETLSGMVHYILPTPTGPNTNGVSKWNSSHHDQNDGISPYHDNTYEHSLSPTPLERQCFNNSPSNIAAGSHDFRPIDSAAASGSGGVYPHSSRSLIFTGADVSLQYDTNGETASSSVFLEKSRASKRRKADITVNKKPELETSMKNHQPANQDKEAVQCIFGFAGCTSKYPSKNEWKRHIRTQHFATTIYSCSECPVVKEKNVFNRLDLFRDHVRRVHFKVLGLEKKQGNPVSTKKREHGQMEGVSAASEKLQAIITKSERARCDPPSRLLCGKATCHQTVDDLPKFLDHIVCHMPSDVNACLGLDQSEALSLPSPVAHEVHLVDWCVKTGVVIKGKTEYTCHSNNTNNRRRSGGNRTGAA